MIRKSYFFVVLFFYFAAFSVNGATIDSVSLDRDTVPQYERLELTVASPDTYSNPFDPDEIDLWGEFTAPSGIVVRINGFWDGNSWKIRFAGGETGQWNYTISMKDSSSTASQPGSFSVSASDHNGWIHVSDRDPHYFEYTDGSQFYGVGFCRPWYLNREPSLFDDMVENGCNLFVLWLASWDNLNLINNNTGYDRYDMIHAANLDAVFEKIESKNINVVLTVWYHDFLRDNNHSWSNPEFEVRNPFRDLSSSTEFFSDPVSWQYQEQLYRYMIARWGYSRSLAMWHTVCEANGSNAIFDPIALENNPDGWHNKINTYFTDNDPFRHPTTASKSGDVDWADGFQVMDCPQVHSYDTADNPIRIGYRMAYWHEQLFVRYAKPGWMGEYGMSASHSDAERTQFIHNGSWAALVSGAATTPMQWLDTGSWGYMSESMYERMKYFRAFVDMIDFPAAKFQMAPNSSAKKGISTTMDDGKIWGLRGDDVSICWLQDTSPGETHSDAVIEFNGFEPGTYTINFYNTWTGEWYGLRWMQTTDGRLNITCPDFEKDIAVRIDQIEREKTERVKIENFESDLNGWTSGQLSGSATAELSFDTTVNEPSSDGFSCRAEISMPQGAFSIVRLESGDLGGIDWSEYEAVEIRLYIPENAPRGLQAGLYSYSGADSEEGESNYDQLLMAGAWNVLRMYRSDFIDATNVSRIGVRINSLRIFSGTVYIDAIRGIIPGEVTMVDDAEAHTPREFVLSQNSPNPFNPVTTISYYVPFETQVKIDVYNVSGQRVETLKNEIMQPGQHSLTWDASNFSSGMYFYMLEADSATKVGKMVLLK